MSVADRGLGRRLRWRVAAGTAAALLLLLVGTASLARSPTARWRLGDGAQRRYSLGRGWAESLARGGRLVRGVPYERVDGWTGRLDLWLPRPSGAAAPVLVWFHGGGWVEGSRDLASLAVQPYARMGFAVANVSYRLADEARAPAAIEDARCAVRWVARHAAEYGLDSSRLVTAGVSAGAHLALMAALDRAGAPTPPACGGGPAPHVAAVVNWYGPTDLTDLAAHLGESGFVAAWLGDSLGSATFQRRVSPLAGVRTGTPPVITLHGALDPLVPVREARMLHASLDSLGVPNHLIVVPRAGHGFSRETERDLRDSVLAFLRARGVLPGRPR